MQVALLSLGRSQYLILMVIPLLFLIDSNFVDCCQLLLIHIVDLVLILVFLEFLHFRSFFVEVFSFDLFWRRLLGCYIRLWKVLA